MMVTNTTGFPVSTLFLTIEPPSYNQLEPDPRFPPLKRQMTRVSNAYRHNKLKPQTHLPVNPEHDRKVRAGGGVSRTGDVEIEAFELVMFVNGLGEEFFRERNTKKLFLEVVELGLRAYRAVMRRV